MRQGALAMPNMSRVRAAAGIIRIAGGLFLTSFPAGVPFFRAPVSGRGKTGTYPPQSEIETTKTETK